MSPKLDPEIKTLCPFSVGRPQFLHIQNQIARKITYFFTFLFSCLMIGLFLSVMTAVVVLCSDAGLSNS